MSALALAVHIRIKPENVERFMAAVKENGTASRAEPGCQVFDILVDPEDRTRVMLYEIYASDAAFDSHQQSAHFKKYVAEAVPLLESRERRFWRRAAP